jgi:hypothetical protein
MRALLLATLLAGCWSEDTPRLPGPDLSMPHELPDFARAPDAQPPTGAAALADTGLYADFAAGTLAPGVIAYTPRYELWSDGATKRRWLYLPPGATIDTSDMDHWAFPIGTKAWKEFTFDGTVVETRLLEKLWDAPRGDGWWEVAYLWNADHTAATAVPDGIDNSFGTFHRVPSQEECGWCHANVRDVLIGVSALQLGAPDGDGTLARLAADGRLSHPPAASYVPPGAGVVQEALGYLHGNCGHCHSPQSGFAVSTRLAMRLLVTDKTPELTDTYTTSIRQKMYHVYQPGDVSLGVVPGAPDQSQLYVRMGLRDDWSMPPRCSQKIDPTGLATVRDWILQLPP